MKQETKNLYTAIILSFLIIFGVNHFFAPTRTSEIGLKDEAKQTQNVPVVEKAEIGMKPEVMSLNEALEKDGRIKIETPALNGSIRLKGARFDFLNLKKYKQTLENDSPNVELLRPVGTENPYFAEFGFLATNPSLVPNSETLWQADNLSLTPQSPVTLTFDNGAGVLFSRRISIDENYLMTISDTVKNNTENFFEFYPYGRINRAYDPKQNTRSVVHEGFTGVIDGVSKEIRVTDVKENAPKMFEGQNAWLGFSDRYWFTAFILDDDSNNTLTLSNNGANNYQADFRGEPVRVAPNASVVKTTRFFAGAKEIKLLDKYAKQDGIEKFDLAVDFGWYYFLTKPFFYILDFLYHLIGNMGWAILLFAALLRLAMFPIANKSYDSMSKMKKIQPKVMALQMAYKNDRMLLQQKTMELYKKEKINPASGCLPMFIQIPIFFSLYKVLNIAIEIRHAPFIGWIKDLSAPDPLTISVWSHIPLPSILDIGVWPILMGLTMWLQQKLSPAPTNKEQAKMFVWLPLIFTLMLGHFASGLVIYWTLSNLLSLMQQKMIMYKNGVK
ncbi:MAG: membrane protein insertase YidC [Alphaproteobacteria bacterium]|nr:membrane protein insertase YidC [Alphaproteobacteria bacterium]